LINDTEAFLAWERSDGRTQRGYAGPAYQQSYPGSAYHAGQPGPRSQDRRSAGPQDMPADEWYRTVQSQVIR